MTARLFLHLVSLEARKQMSYRVDFWVRTALGFLAELGAYVFLAWALFAESGATEIRGYDRPGLTVYFLAVMLLGRLVRTPESADSVADDIYGGGLTKYLLFPRPYLPIKYAQAAGRLLPVVIQCVFLGALALALIERPADLGVTPGGVARAAVSAALGNLLYFLILYPAQLFAFWQDNVWSFAVMLRNTSRLLGGAMVPLALFPAWGRAALGWLPFRHLYDVPVRALLGRLGPGEWAVAAAQAAAWCGVFYLFGAWVWRRGDRRYTGIGI